MALLHNAVRTCALVFTAGVAGALVSTAPVRAMVVIDNSWNGMRPLPEASYTLPSGVNFRTGPEPLGYNITGLVLSLLRFPKSLPDYRLVLLAADGPFADPTGEVLAEVDLYMTQYYASYYGFGVAALGAIAELNLEPETYYNLSLYPDPATVWPDVSGWIYAPGPYDVAGGFEAPTKYESPESMSPVYQLSVEPIPAVPGPLPLLGLPVAFGCARRLRRRLCSETRSTEGQTRCLVNELPDPVAGEPDGPLPHQPRSAEAGAGVPHQSI